MSRILNYLAVGLIVSAIASTLTGCMPSVSLDCETKVQKDMPAPQQELAVVVAPTQGFVNFDNAFDSSRGHLSDLISLDGTEVTTVLADGAPRQFSQSMTDYSGALTENDKGDSADSSLAAIKRLYRCVIEDVSFDVAPGSDILASLRAASSSLDTEGVNHRIVFIGNGIQSGGQLPLDQLGLPTRLEEVSTYVSQLKSDAALPDLHGATVDFLGIGMADGKNQPILNQQSRDVLIALWTAVVEESDGIIGKIVEDFPAEAPAAGSIEIPKVESLNNACLYTLDESAGFEFEPDTATFIDRAKAQSAAERIAAELKNSDCVGELVVTGYAASGTSKTEYPAFESRTMALSLERARAFEALLVSAGVINSISTVGGGKGPFNDWNEDGSFNEEDGRKNRIVEIAQR
jgi:outer membrane protein OmpA-like peptidoglycan-associated protein